ncbi:NUDIX hydrolase domain protein [Pseudocohnilembus persalinus]|uniref:NUDIX hydrolase domain protein n=1 Tax=Pseudocohnilembus persalinus TaxID=266149 RepID=A0A0V0QWY0_PSEPJ|nr:NUDIX hydrolase domain protein [Pseudocohnilembus persalinus]|eukprot:KRX06759.1 NUDIX hydrolase domain protein [Pseudocohnilembus persalinus]
MYNYQQGQNQNFTHYNYLENYKQPKKQGENQNRPKIGVGVIVFNKYSQNVLLSKRKDNGLFGFPGGHLEFGEDIEYCSSRELKEETNLQIDQKEFKVFKCLNVKRLNINYHYVNFFTIAQFKNAYISQKIVNLEPEKHEDWEWVSCQQMENLYKNGYLFYGLEDMVKNAFDGSCQKMYQGFTEFV